MNHNDLLFTTQQIVLLDSGTSRGQLQYSAIVYIPSVLHWLSYLNEFLRTLFFILMVNLIGVGGHSRTLNRVLYL